MIIRDARPVPSLCVFVKNGWQAENFLGELPGLGGAGRGWVGPVSILR